MENKKLFLGVVVLAVAVLLVPMFLSKRNQAPEPTAAPPSAPTTTPTPAPPPPSALPAKPVVTAAVLDKLLYGMTYDQVVELVGTEADESESQYERDKTGYTGPTLTIWKTWLNPDGSKLRVGFVESKLEQKQFKIKERDKTPDAEKEEP